MSLMASLQPGQTSAAVRRAGRSDRHRTPPGNLNIMRRAAVPIIIADYQHGEAAAGQHSCTADAGGRRHCGDGGRHSGWELPRPARQHHRDPQAWEPDPACTPRATDGGLSLAPLLSVVMGHAIGTRSSAAAGRGSEVGIASRRRAAPSAAVAFYAVDVTLAADVWYSATRRTVDCNQAGLLTQPHEHLA